MYLQYKMFLLNHQAERYKKASQTFTIQNVPIKFISFTKGTFEIKSFTIQNVPIKF